MIFEKAGKGQKGYNAIKEAFTLEIVEIQIVGKTYEQDKLILEHLEDYWINTLTQQGEILYNVGSGSVGAHVSYRNSPHGRKELIGKVRRLIAHGFRREALAKYLDLPMKLTISKALDALILDATGKTFAPARIELIMEQVFEILDIETPSLKELADHFNGMNTNDLFKLLADKNNPGGNDYLKGYLAKMLITLGGSLNLEKYLRTLSVTDYAVNTFMLREMNLRGTTQLQRFIELELNNVNVHDLIKWMKFYATTLIKHVDTSGELLQQLGLDSESSIMKKSYIKQLFGVSFDVAKDMYVDGFLGTR